MADAADQAEEATIDTPGDGKRDELPGQQTSIAADVPPRKPRGRPKGSKSKPKDTAAAGAAGGDSAGEQEKKELRKLKKRLTGILKGPATLLEPWPAEHVEGTAPDFADAIVKLAEEDPKLRRRLLAFFEGGTTANLIAAGLIYALPVAVYYGAPAPPMVRRLIDIPDRQLYLAEQSGQHMPPPPPVPSEEELLAEAEAAGFKDPGEYMRATQDAVRTAIGNVRGPHYPTARPESPAQDS